MFRPGWERTEDERKVCKALEEVAKQVGTSSIQAGKQHLTTGICAVTHVRMQWRLHT